MIDELRKLKDELEDRFTGWRKAEERDKEIMTLQHDVEALLREAEFERYWREFSGTK